MSVGYQALTEDAALIDRADRVRLRFDGDGARATLNGLLSSDVTKLTPAHGQRGTALTAKGRLIAPVRVFALDEWLLVDADAISGVGLVAMMRKFVNPRLAKWRDLGETMTAVGVRGPAAAPRLATRLALDGATLDALPSLGVLPLPAQSGWIVREDDLGVPGFDLLLPPDAGVAFRGRWKESGGVIASSEAVETLRIECGAPRPGAELDEEIIPQEADLGIAGALAFDKGCYTGQEVVARIHFRGHVNRHLRRLRATERIPVGATVLDLEGKEVGTVRSEALSPRIGPVAIAMVRREIALGSVVRLRTESAMIEAQVAPLYP